MYEARAEKEHIELNTGKDSPLAIPGVDSICMYRNTTKEVVEQSQ
jgi:hypothetical protein